MINTNKLKINLKIVVILFFSLFVSGLILQLVIPLGPRHPSNLAVKITVAQTDDHLLNLQSLDVQKTPPQQYMFSYRHNFYTVKILDEKNKELFSGEILNQYIIPPHEYGPAILKVKTPNSLTLNLPYFKSAKKIIFLDEFGKTKLEVAINNLSVPK